MVSKLDSREREGGEANEERLCGAVVSVLFRYFFSVPIGRGESRIPTVLGNGASTLQPARPLQQEVK